MSTAQRTLDEIAAVADDKDNPYGAMRVLSRHQAVGDYYMPKDRREGYIAAHYRFPDGSGLAYLSNPAVGADASHSWTVQEDSEKSREIVAGYARMLRWHFVERTDYGLLVWLNQENET